MHSKRTKKLKNIRLLLESTRIVHYALWNKNRWRRGYNRSDYKVKTAMGRISWDFKNMQTSIPIFSKYYLIQDRYYAKDNGLQSISDKSASVYETVHLNTKRVISLIGEVINNLKEKR